MKLLCTRFYLFPPWMASFPHLYSAASLSHAPTTPTCQIWIFIQNHLNYYISPISYFPATFFVPLIAFPYLILCLDIFVLPPSYRLLLLSIRCRCCRVFVYLVNLLLFPLQIALAITFDSWPFLEDSFVEYCNYSITVRTSVCTSIPSDIFGRPRFLSTRILKILFLILSLDVSYIIFWSK